ncbi:hypothetical protein BH11PAT2_BH11PAT2_07650 [soil metagenome]
MTINTPAKRTIRRDRGMGLGAQLRAVKPETLREELVSYDDGLVATLVVGKEIFYNAEPYGFVKGDPNSNQPYWQGSGMKGVLTRLRGLPEDFVPANRNEFRCNFKVVRVTEYNLDATVRRVSIAITGNVTDVEQNCKVVMSGNITKVNVADGVQLIAIDNMAGVVINPIAARADAA